VFQDAPIYQKLIEERGDVPALVRSEAERIARDLSRVIAPLQTPAYPAPGQGHLGAPGGPSLLPGPALPPGRPHR
jgi:hypothetical protein